MEVEKSAFKRLIETDVSKALRHGFLAERRASHVRAIGADVGVRRLDTAAVIGAGLMGTGIAQCLAAPGNEVTQIGRAHVCTPVTNAQLVCRPLLENKNTIPSHIPSSASKQTRNINIYTNH